MKWRARFLRLLQDPLGERRRIRSGRINVGSPGQKNIRETAGFTLLELVIAMVVIMIIGAIAYPSFQKFATRGKLKAAARDLMGDFANAKARAGAENVNYRITFNITNNSYSIQAVTGGPVITKTPTAIDKGISIDSASINPITFDTRGTVGYGTFVLKNTQGSTATITTTITGRTYVEFQFQ